MCSSILALFFAENCIAYFTNYTKITLVTLLPRSLHLRFHASGEKPIKGHKVVASFH